MRYDFSDDPYYQTAKEEAEQARLEKPSECDCCQQMKVGCVDVVYMGMDTHACPKCRSCEDDY